MRDPRRILGEWGGRHPRGLGGLPLLIKCCSRKMMAILVESSVPLEGVFTYIIGDR